MNLEQLFQQYTTDPRSEQIVATLNKKEQLNLQLKGLIGAQPAFVITAIHQLYQKPFLVVAQDKEEAAHWQNDISSLLKKGKEALFFPDSYRRPMGFDKLDRTCVLQRTETVSKLVEHPNAPAIVVTYPEALFEKVVAPSNLKDAAIEIKVGTELDVPFLVEILVEYGFVKVDFVYEPGQFSVRGGIIDIYSYGNEHPYRVELFDVEVESIRTFDPTSQLSTRKIAFVTIVPNVNTEFEAQQKVSLLEVLPKETVVWMADTQMLLDKLQTCFEKSKEFLSVVEELAAKARGEESLLLQGAAFLYPREVIGALDQYSVLELSNETLLKPTTLISYQTTPQPSFNKNFKVLIQNLEENTKKGITNYIFAENVKQIERFYSIFEDLDVQVQWHSIPTAIHQGFVDYHLKVAVYTDHQIFERYHRSRLRQGFDKNTALKIKALSELKPGDFVTHIDHGVGRYGGLEKIELQGKHQEAVKLVYKDNDILYVGIQSLHKISKFTGKEGSAPKVHKLGSNAWVNTKRKTKKKIKELAFDLIKLYAKRKSTVGIEFPEDSYLQNELEASFIYEDTPDQAKATQEVKEDMMKPYPMDRLICGDVGFGKTEIAVRAAFKAIVAGKQVAVLVPTTILALQHAQTFRERLKKFDVKVEYINRFRTTKEKTAIYKKLEAGEIDLLIGTHAILNKKVKFGDLGLLIVDEEQKFGVGAKEKLRNIRVNVDTLTLTATPIPRTLQFSLLAARDLSVMNTPPPNRQPIETEVRIFSGDMIKEAIENEVNRGGQVFFVHNRVQNLADMASMVKELCPNVDIAMAHGQMDATALEQTLMDFIKGYYEVLICTNIIETGLDISNANTIIINNAHHFGLSDLHQLRGRVGRSNKKAFCYLLAPPMSTLTSDARKRLQTVEQFSELGSGFNIAMRDLDIRGAGNLLGGEQSGFVMNMGYETYQKILNEAIQELKQTDYKELFKEELEQKREFVQDVNIESDLDLMIPDEYVASIQERLALYQELNKIKDEAGIAKFKEMLEDRFGKTPKAVNNLFEAIRIRWKAKGLGFERIMLKNRKLRCYFVSDQQSAFFDSQFFGTLLGHIQKKSDHRFFLKQSTRYLMLVCENVKDFKQTHEILQQLEKAVLKEVVEH
ncbi:transcription-repair coupling factor [Aureispira anguillae]|uniref:Transcription-repair-coupling factor n=1 Tax=Aureispira anguillae TaxID=2864201 RepID=A0A915YIY8_9BACT|nr:transcription-repair coupling factor [Aureispira anguillae]BDS14068.1 transcription-repair coupling factor [Aureispira anguillae]